MPETAASGAGKQSQGCHVICLQRMNDLLYAVRGDSAANGAGGLDDSEGRGAGSVQMSRFFSEVRVMLGLLT